MYIETKEQREKIIDQKFWDIYYDPELRAFEVHWKDEGEDIEEDLFKQYLFHFIELAKRYKVVGFLTDTRAYHHVMTPDLQAWHDEVIVPQYVELGLQKIVFVLNEDNFIASLSVEQTFEEEQAQAIAVHFTDNMGDAKGYFVSNTE